MKDFLWCKVNDPAEYLTANSNGIIAKIGYIKWKRSIALGRRGKRLS